MVKGARSSAEKLAELISGIEAEAYARGRADARKELRDLLTAGSGRGARATPASGRRAGKAATPARRVGGGKRAPRGSVRRFVERVLGEHPGATVPEIAGYATTGAERSIKPGSIRVELSNGRKQGRYVSDNRRWSLAGSDPAADETGRAVPSEPSPAAPPGGGGETATGSGQGDDSSAPGQGSGTTLGLSF